MTLSFYLVLMISGGNDVIASVFQVSVNATTYVGRVALFVLPPIVYFVTKRWCLALQRSDEELLHHGIESGTIRRLPTGEFVEETVALPAVYRAGIAGAQVEAPALAGAESDDEHVEQPVRQLEPVRTRGFFRDKAAEKVKVPVVVSEAPELERSGRPAMPE